MSVPRRPWEPREAPATKRSRLIAVSRGAGIAALVLFVVTGSTVAGIIGSNQRHGVTPAAAAGLPASSSSVGADPASSTSTVSAGGATLPPPSSAAALAAIAQPKSQGQPGIVPVPLVPRATAGPIPLLAWQAYHRAAAASGCKLPWYVLAGIGKIESNHGRYGGAQFDITGTVHPAIFGPPTAYGRAMGPMQFIPPTWASYAADGNNDDITDPQNIFDATKAAAHYLCTAGGPDLSGLAAQRRAVFAYNHLDSYVADVLAFATAYQHSQPETVVHLVPIVYATTATTATKVTATGSSQAPTLGHSSAGTTSPTSASPTTSTSATSPSSTGVPSTTVPPTTATCVTTSSAPSSSASGSATASSADRASSAAQASSAARASSAVPAGTSGSTSAVPMRTTAASATTTAPSSPSPTCSPCPTSTATSTPTSTPASTPTTSASPTSTVTACPTTPSPTTVSPTSSATTAARTTAGRTPRS